MKVHVAIVMLLVIGRYFKLVECAGKKLDIEGLKDMLKPMSKSCLKKTGVSEELVAGTANGIWPRERPLMCYIKCLATMLKVINKQGELSMKDVNRQLNTLVIEELVPRMKQILEDCVAKTPEVPDICEYAFDIIVCGYNTDPSLYFLPS